MTNRDMRNGEEGGRITPTLVSCKQKRLFMIVQVFAWMWRVMDMTDMIKELYLVNYDNSLI